MILVRHEVDVEIAIVIVIAKGRHETSVIQIETEFAGLFFKADAAIGLFSHIEIKMIGLGVVRDIDIQITIVIKINHAGSPAPDTFVLKAGTSGDVCKF